MTARGRKTKTKTRGEGETDGRKFGKNGWVCNLTKPREEETQERREGGKQIG